MITAGMLRALLSWSTLKHLSKQQGKERSKRTTAEGARELGVGAAAESRAHVDLVGLEPLLAEERIVAGLHRARLAGRELGGCSVHRPAGRSTCETETV